MMIRRKLRSKSGETLAEVLVAMLIVAFASMLFFAMISVSASIDMTAQRRDRSFYAELTRAETHDTDEGQGSGSVVITVGSDSSDYDVAVETFGGGGLTSYGTVSEGGAG